MPGKQENIPHYALFNAFLCHMGVFLPRQIEQGQGSISLPDHAAKLPGSDVDCKGIESTSCFVIQDHQSRHFLGARRVGHREMMCLAVCSVASHSQFEKEARSHLCMDKQIRPTPERRRFSLT